MDPILAILSTCMDYLAKLLTVLIPTLPSFCWPTTLLVIVALVLAFPTRLAQVIAHHSMRVKLPTTEIELHPDYGPSLPLPPTDQPTTERAPRIIPIHQAYALGGILMVLANSIGFGAKKQKIQQQATMARQLARNVGFSDDSLRILDAMERDIEKGDPNEPLSGVMRMLNVERAHALATELNDELWRHVERELPKLPQKSPPRPARASAEPPKSPPTDPKDS